MSCLRLFAFAALMSGTGLAARAEDPGALTARDRESHVFFLSGGAELDAEAIGQIDRLARVLDTAPLRTACIQLVGHADTPAEPEVNVPLSQQRAEAVARRLRPLIGDPSRLRPAIGAGATRGLPGFPTDADQNRRVEILLGPCPGASG